MERLIPSHITSGEDAWEAWEWEPAQTLSHCVERGLAYPRRAFRIYLKPKSSGIDRAILSFTRDDQLVLGLPIPDQGEESEARSKLLLQQLAKEFQCHLGAVAVEEPPPGDEVEFQAAETAPRTLFFSSFSA